MGLSEFTEQSNSTAFEADDI